MLTKIFLSSIEIMTSTVDIKDDSRGRPVQKAKVIRRTAFLLCYFTMDDNLEAASLVFSPLKETLQEISLSYFGT